MLCILATHALEVSAIVVGPLSNLKLLLGAFATLNTAVALVAEIKKIRIAPPGQSPLCIVVISGKDLPISLPFRYAPKIYRASRGCQHDQRDTP